MALKIRFARPKGAKGWLSLLLLVVGVIVIAGVLTGLSIFSYFYYKYERIVDDRLKQPIFANTAKVYAAPREVRPGQKLTVRLIANELREAGYTDESAPHRSELGTYAESVGSITVHPGPQSYHAQDGATITINGTVVQSISDDHGQGLASYELEPLLITGLSEDENRSKRRLITYEEIPPNLVQAVVAMALELGVEIIAEGIEKEEESQMLQSLACPLGQGYLFARPKPLDDILKELMPLKKSA